MITHEDQPRFNALVIGFYGAPNVGDEVLLAVLIEAIRARGGQVTAASIDPEGTRRMHGVEAIDFNDLGQIAGALAWADVLIMGGGGIFQDHHPFNISALYDPLVNDIAAYARPMLMARQFGVPVIVWGHGVGPLKGQDGRTIVRDLFQTAYAVTVRDEESRGLLNIIGVQREIRVGPDPGWLYRHLCIGLEHPPVAPRRETGLLAIVVREWVGDSWKENLVAALRQVLAQGWNVQWIALQAHVEESGATSDLPLVEEIRNLLPEALRGEVMTPRTPREAWDLLAEADAVFSMRLHASILALQAGRPVAGLEYDMKLSQAHRMAGLPDVLRLQLDASKEQFVAALQAVMNGKWVPDRERIALLEEQAGIHLAVLDKSVAERRTQDWSGGGFDWLATWLQQGLSDLRIARNRSKSAHELLSYRDHLLSQKQAELDELRDSLKQVEAARFAAHELAEYRDFVLQETKAELAAVREVVAQEGRQLDEAQAQLAEHGEEIDRRDAYIRDKEMYIARLLEKNGSLAEEVGQLRLELRDARDTRKWILAFIRTLRRDFLRMVLAPYKLASVWRKYGWRVMLDQARRRVNTLGKPLPELMSKAWPHTTHVRPVRSERLLVIGGIAMENGWLARWVELTKAAARAGFLVRVWQPAAEGSKATAPAGIASLCTDKAQMLAEVRPGGGTRLLVCDASQASLDAAREAKERGAEIVLDLPSSGLEPRDDLAAWGEIVDRFVSRGGTVDPRFEGLTISAVSDAGDNELFDSYKSYSLPETYSKRRPNLLLFAYGTDALRRANTLAASMQGHLFHMVAKGVESQGNIRTCAFEIPRRPELLAAADAVVFMADPGDIPGDLRQLALSALLMERPFVSEVDPGVGYSRNLHFMKDGVLREYLSNVKSEEDYAFVSRNTWLGRAEALMQAKFPESVSVIVLIHNNRRIIERCISTMLEHGQAWLHEIIVVDNQSSDGGAELVEELYGAHPKVKLVRNAENGCASGRNLGVKESSGKYIAFFDSDQWLTSPSSFAEAIWILEHGDHVGAIGWNAGWFDARREDLGGAISDYLPARGMNDVALENGYRDDIGFLGTSGMFMRRDLFDRIQGFDTYYDPTCFEDTDICFQIKAAGYLVAFRDLAGVRHQPHQTTGASEGSEGYQRLFNRNAAYFREKWARHPEFFVDLNS